MQCFVLPGSVLRICLAILHCTIVMLLPLTHARAERVGFTFSGKMLMGSTANNPLFGAVVSVGSPITGTFSYDTTSMDSIVDPQTKTYHQTISGGFNLNINGGSAIHLSASDYVITVANDVMPSEDSVDQFIIDYDTRITPPPAPLTVNGQPWTKSAASIHLELSWPSTTFPDPDEPKLTSDRPLTVTPQPRVFAYVGSPTLRMFSVTDIKPIYASAGDYNFDGIVSADDYIEWRGAFGQSDPAFLYADGNRNGVVDTADYVIWRNEMGLSGASAAAVPEPSSYSLTLIVVCLVLIVHGPARS